MHLFQTWQFNLFLYYFCVVSFWQNYRILAKATKREGAATAILQTIAGLFVLLLAPFFAFTLPTSLKSWILISIACIFYAINDRILTTARKHLEVSTLSIITQLSNVFLIIIGIMFFRDAVVAKKLLGAALILGSSVAIIYKKSTHKFKPDTYTAWAIVSTLAFATAISIDIGISKQFNIAAYISFTLIVPALIIVLAERLSIKQIKNEYEHSDKRRYLITGASWALTIFFSLRAFQLGRVSVIVPLEAAAIFLNVLAGYIFLHEKTNIIKKVLAACVAIIGVALTVL